MDNDMLQRFRRMATPTLYDVMDKMGISNQALSHAIQPLERRMRLAGRAFTIKGSPAPRWDGSAGPALRYDLFRKMESGCVVVMETGGNNTSGPWGQNTALSARNAGAEGIVIDGGTRDTLELIDMGFPTFTRFGTPVLSHGRWQIDDFNVPISMSGQVDEMMRVAPGDIVVGDADGVVVVPHEIAGEVLAFAADAQEVEAEIARALENGEDREEVDRRFDRWRLLKASGKLKQEQT